MDLSNSQNLIKPPNFNGLQSLERLILRGCIRLHKLHPSVGSLKRLLELNLDGTAIEELPLTIEDLTGRSVFVKSSKLQKNFELSKCVFAIS